MMSGSQKFVMVISILNLIGGIILIGAGIFAVVAGASAGDEEGAGLAVTGILLAVLGLIEIIAAILGIRAARDARKSGAFYFISLVSFLFAILGIIASIPAGGFHLATLGSIILPALMFYCARNIRKQGRGER